jgi:hypothetical protein
MLPTAVLRSALEIEPRGMGRTGPCVGTAPDGRACAPPRTGRAGRECRAAVAVAARPRPRWCLGTLVVLTTMPTVPIDDEILAAPSIGTPIGCGIYLAWTNVRRSRRNALIGFAASTAAALVGA